MSNLPRIIAFTPFELPSPRLAAAVGRAGALAVLDLGREPAAAAAALAALDQDGAFRGGFAVRVPDGAEDALAALAPLPARVTAVVASAGARVDAGGRALLVEVTTLAEARAAVAAGAAALLAKGHESGGRVGEETTFVLLQRLAAAGLGVPVYAHGGVGVHTAAAAIAGGAAGVVLDAQLALVAEAALPAGLRQAIAAMDGSETAVVGGRRVLARPGQAPDPAAPPVGQDAAFARPLAERYRTAAGVVRGVEQAIASHLRQAQALAPLAEGGRWARGHGLRYPIAQGPMTRVSDRAAFAGAVADAGALPFVALSLLRAAEARPLLEETAARCAGKPWGVGILGFAPPALREEQLAILAEVAPPVVLIAGGRPAQARPLEERGIATYLHVPSPGLLDLFLKDGHRRFVLEGRECGGHVGPRTSFVLWEAAIERLVRDPAAAQVSILFAGGVHDARSAAMVAAAAAPLAARGARVGVLMGTAYLFTEEAVASGAILPGFQAEALRCAETVLLDTAPGHSTRCAPTPYVAAFAAEAARLAAAGADPQAAWAELEQLNVGRLRIAAKGVARQGDALVAVDEAAQRAEGMYMIGQVAALRGAVTTMAALHREVCEGGTRHLAEVELPSAPAATGPRAPRVAIVGMAGVFPGAGDVEAFWRGILAGADAVTEIPKDRWSVEAYYDPDGTGDKTPSKWGGFLAPVAFEPGLYGIPPRSLAAIEPVQLLALEVARRALGDAGYLDRDFDRERASVVFGAEAGTDLSSAYGFRALHRQYLGEVPPELDEVLPTLTEDSFPGILANVIAGRIANRLDLGGVNFTVDAACASSLAAVDVACKELAGGETDLVVCGGADLHNAITDYLMFASVHALSKTGRCRTFDAKADGIALGEAVAAVVLKRLDDAERDGDRIYAVIDAVAGSSDGKSLGLTAPRKDGQVRALERAYRRAGVSPAEIELVEAHGTGTVVGDRTELETLTEIFGGAGARPGQVTLGSVKSNIGHTKCAAGLAGLVKVALAIHRRVLPPTLHVAAPNPFWDGETSPFVFRDRPAPWPSARRRAAISAFGFGGTNFHAVLSDAGGDAPASGSGHWPAELFAIRAATRAEADAVCARLAALAGPGAEGAAVAPYALAELARATWARGEGPVQIAFVASSLAELAERATRARGLARSGGGVFVPDLAPEITGGALATLFPGQGSQRPGMLDELLVALPRLQRALRGGGALVGAVYPGAAFSPAARTAQRAAVTDTRVAQPALGMVDLAAHHLLEAVGVRAAMFAGQSYGELVALCAAGVLAEDELVELSRARARCILDAAAASPAGTPGTMAAVRAGAAAIAAALGELVGAADGVVLANHNAPDQTVIAGTEAAVAAACARLVAAGLEARPIPVAAAFHSPIVAGGAEAFAAHLARATVRPPSRPAYSNSLAAPYPAAPDAVREVLAGQIARPVRFVEEIEAMYAAGARIFVEAGPGAVLGDLVRRILGDRPHLAVAIDGGGGGGLAALLAALARLATAGVAIDLAPLFEGRAEGAFDLDAPPARGPSPTAWLVDGQRAWPVSGAAPDFAMKLVPAPVKVAATSAPAAAGPAEQVVGEYLRGMRELVASQRDVMLRYLGAAPAALAPVVLDAVATVVEPAAAGAAAKPAAAPAAATRTPLEVLVEVVGERTGYPAEMLDPELDLEADLGIDSIKRIEILGALAERLGLDAGGGGSAELVEQLAGVKTLRGIATWLAGRDGASSGGAEGASSGAAETARSSASSSASSASSSASSSSAASSSASSSSAASSSPAAAPRAARPAVRRYVVAREALAAPAAAHAVAGRAYLVTDDGRGVAAALASRLRAAGARADVVLAIDGAALPVDGLVHLAPLAEAEAPGDVRKDVYELARLLPTGQARALLCATAQGGVRGARPAHGGVAGLLRSVARELPEARVQAIDVDPAQPVEAQAAAIWEELVAAAPVAHVQRGADGRHRLRAVAAEHAGEAPALALGAGDVALVTGGARGITARVALALAARGVAVELVGRTPAPADEPAGLAACHDEAAIRRWLVDAAPPAERSPAKIEAALREIVAARGLRATFAALAAAGAPWRYHAADVRDPDAVAGLVADARARHGKLDAVIHGAGVIEDRLLRDKTRASFDRVFDTKVGGAAALIAALPDEVRFVVFFSSVSGVFGNRGQVDYAAANDALDDLAHHLAARGRARVLAASWGPWADTGMISPELEREYARRGVGLIDPDEGVARLLDELARGGPPHVVFMSAEPEALDGAPAGQG